MSKTKFTPGPWKNYAPIIKGEKDETYRTIEAGAGYFGIKDSEDHGFQITGYISKKNADLMTAAPDLYEALEKMVECFSVVSNTDQVNAYNEAKAALAKARGE